jgi:G3E family GTPase
MKLFLLSGFLGSGKTTAIWEVCGLLMREGRRVAVITNDQGTELVDSAYFRGKGIEGREVGQGCFCCRFDDLERQLLDLSAGPAPEIVFAETVGSCADLVATVVRPLEQRADLDSIVLSVFADASMLWPIINGETYFLSEDVRYIYRKQLEEADILVLNKADLLPNDHRERLTGFLREQYPGKTVLVQDSTNADSVRLWFSVLTRFRPSPERASLDIDYDRYARGEQVLGWLDEKLVIQSQDGSAAEAAHRLVRDIHRRIHKAGLPIGHIKFLLDDGHGQRKYSYTTMSGSGPFPGGDPRASNRVEILVNLRVQADPELLDDLVKGAIASLPEHHQVRVSVISARSFQPGYPQPVHRITE